jgi:hypothetical protein
MIDVILTFILTLILTHILTTVLVIVAHHTVGGIRLKIRTVAFHTRLINNSVSTC